MSNDWLIREVMKQVINIENQVARGNEGLCEVRELWQWLGENDEQQIFSAEKIVNCFSEDVRKALLQGFIENFCE